MLTPVIQFKMIDIRINYTGEESSDNEFIIDTKIPHVPLSGDTIGFWCRGKWILAKVGYIVYEFDDHNEFLRIELNVFN